MLKVWIFIKRFWYVPLLLILAIILMIFYRKNNIAMELLNNAIESYKKQIAEIERLNRESQIQKDELQKKYNIVLEQIEKKYKEDSQNLSKAQEKRVKELVEQYKDDEEMLVAAFANEFGIKLEK